MARKKNPGNNDGPSPDELGAFNGETIRLAAVRLSGAIPIDRRLDEGERILLTVEATVGLPTFRRAEGGALLMVYAVKIEGGAEPAGRLGDDIEALLREAEDRREGRQQLPGFDDTTRDTDEDGTR